MDKDRQTDSSVDKLPDYCHVGNLRWVKVQRVFCILSQARFLYVWKEKKDEAGKMVLDKTATKKAPPPLPIR